MNTPRLVGIIAASIGLINRTFRLTVVAAGISSASVLSGQTVALPYQLTVKPIYVQNGPGGVIAVQTNYSDQISLFRDATQALFAQAGVRVYWESDSIHVSATHFTIPLSTAAAQTWLGELTDTAGNGQSPNSTYPTPATGSTLNLWFTGSSGGVLGFSHQSFNTPQSAIITTPVLRNGGAVAESIFAPTGNRSLNVIAHEIAHVLGLTHNVINPYNANPSASYYSNSTVLAPLTRNMMADGYLGATTLDQITRDGVTGHGILTANQIELLRLSPFIVANTTPGDMYTYAIPEPATVALFVGVGAVLFAIWRRKTRAAA